MKDTTQTMAAAKWVTHKRSINLKKASLSAMSVTSSSRDTCGQFTQQREGKKNQKKGEETRVFMEVQSA